MNRLTAKFLNVAIYGVKPDDDLAPFNPMQEIIKFCFTCLEP